MTHTRQNIWTLPGGTWDPIIEWYAKGVGALQARPLGGRTSWRFLAAMHGFAPQMWTQQGYLGAADALPPASDQSTFWKQCQHQTWYFLPWHRGYLGAFEQIVRAAIVILGGPATWALPYWNYSDTTNPDATTLPTAFSQPTMPGGAPNPLYVTARYGAGTSPITLPPADVTLGALAQPLFAGTNAGASTGFGGPKTLFHHGGGNGNGRLESQPHNLVHSDVGGQSANGDPGLMSDPDIAALDPIFWVHHANIDRLWEVWLKRNPAHLNPTLAQWLTGPANRTFTVPSVAGAPTQYAAKDMLDTQAPNLDYVYDDTSDPLAGVHRVAARLANLQAAGAPVPAAPAAPAQE
ncbi:MAG: tyrosinase family protein, partial [Caulobacterales bacterium]